MKPYYADESVTLHQGDALGVLVELEDGSVDCCVTSPPYYRLRDYGIDGQQGIEPTPAEYVEGMVAVFAEVRRVLADDGTLWLNIGDSYSGSWGNQGRKTERGAQRPINGPMMQPVHDGRYGNPEASGTGSIREGMPPAKNLLGIPWRLAFALQDDGWILRNDIVWNKTNAMPESVTDRLSCKHEYVFLLSKSRRYWFDLDPIREPLAESSIARLSQRVDEQPGSLRAYGGTRSNRPMKAVGNVLPGRNRPRNGGPQADKFASGSGGRNPGDVWTVPTQPFSEAHFAVMPLALAERCVQAGCKPGGVVLDPYSGSGTTGLAAARHGRRYVGIDLSADYLALSLRTRLAQAALVAAAEPGGAQ